MASHDSLHCTAFITELIGSGNSTEYYELLTDCLIDPKKFGGYTGLSGFKSNNSCLYFHTNDDKLRGGFHAPKWVFELDLDLSCVRTQTVSELQLAVVGLRFHHDSSSILQLGAILKPCDL